MVKNQAISLFIVWLSFNPVGQLAACTAVNAIFAIYSILFCPYAWQMRIFFHIN